MNTTYPETLVNPETGEVIVKEGDTVTLENGKKVYKCLSLYETNRTDPTWTPAFVACFNLAAGTFPELDYQP